jgi:hypothetical protein
METPFKKGQAVRQKVVPIEGNIRRQAWDEGRQTMCYLVGFSLPGEPDADGDPTTDNHERWFDHSDLVDNSKEGA